jgi:hypothetical protein
MHNHNFIEIEIEFLRDIITGKQTYRKCLACDKNGREYWDETGTSVLPYPHPDWKDNYECGPCDNCDGIGYVPNPSESN